MRIESRGDTPPVEYVDAVVLYDRSSGEIVHIHRVVTFKGATHPGRDAVAKEARTLAERVGKSTQNADVLPCEDLDFLQSDKEYKVDVATRKLVQSGVKRAPEARGARDSSND